MLNGSITPMMLSQRFKPYKYQQRAIKWLVQKPNAALFLDPGLGKTAVALSAFQALRKARKARCALVVAPLRPCHLVWSRSGELGKWSDFHDLRYELLHGPKKEEAFGRDADIYVINYDGLRWLINSDRICNLQLDTLIFDELSKLKHTRTQRFKMLKPWFGKFPRRWGLTGSPASNGLMDLFGQMYAIDLGASLGRYITYYRHNYFIPTGYKGYDWQPKPTAERDIYKAIGKTALSMRAIDHLDLPKLVEQDLWVELPPKPAKQYRQMEDDLITAIDGGLVTAANAAVASGKCRQIASGGLYSQPDPTKPRQVEQLHNAKTEALVDLVDELQGSPLLVAYEFDHDLARIRATIGKDVPAINGKTPAARAVDLVNAWNKGELPLLCGHPAAMGHGLNLQAAGNHICWYSLTWDFELYDQLVRRVWRQGNTSNRVVVHRILARRTVDEAVSKALRSKKRRQDALLNALKKMRR